jgi:glutamine phosphoribosylpyrophosphate amidotransferase
MCGIAGTYNKNGIPEDRAVIERMSLAIEHRGPDEEGFHLDNHVHLASRRLSIIDLSAGEQPIYNKDHSRCIVYNGEIYNYQSLKKELSSRGHVFKTNTDTEVVLLAYEEWREKFLNWFIDSAGEMLRDLLSYENITKAGYFNPAFVDYLLAEYNKKGPVDYSGTIVVIFFIQLWHDIFIANN